MPRRTVGGGTWGRVEAWGWEGPKEKLSQIRFSLISPLLVEAKVESKKTVEAAVSLRQKQQRQLVSQEYAWTNVAKRKTVE